MKTSDHLIRSTFAGMLTSTFLPAAIKVSPPKTISKKSAGTVKPGMRR